MRFINVSVDATARTTLEGRGGVRKKKNAAARGLISTSSEAISQAGSQSIAGVASEKRVSGDRVCERSATAKYTYRSDCCAIAIKAICNRKSAIINEPNRVDVPCAVVYRGA